MGSQAPGTEGAAGAPGRPCFGPRPCAYRQQQLRAPAGTLVLFAAQGQAMLEKGAISRDEFETLKHKALVS